MNPFPHLHNGPSPSGEKADRENLISGAPFQTHSGPGFRAELRGQFREVFHDDPAPEAPLDDAWVIMGSPFSDLNIHINSASDPRRNFRRRYTATGGIAGWSGGITIVTPDGKGKGYFTTMEPFFGDWADLDINLLGRYGRSVKWQFHVTAWAHSIEFQQFYITLIYVDTWLYFYDYMIHFRAENWAYMDGDVQRNEPLLRATIRDKVTREWNTVYIPNVPLIAGYDAGMLRPVPTLPDRMVLIGCEHPDNYPSVYHGNPLTGGWSKSSSGLSAAFPGDVEFDPLYWTTEDEWGENQIPEVTDGQEKRQGWLNQMTVKIRTRSRGTSSEFAAISSRHVVFMTGEYPLVAGGSTGALSTSVVDVLTGAVSNTITRSFASGAPYWYIGYLTILGRDSWVLEYVRGRNLSDERVLMKAEYTFDGGASYTDMTLLPGQVTHSIVPFRPVEKDENGDIVEFEAVLLCAEADGRRTYSTKDFVTFKREGLAAKAELIDDDTDFVRMFKLGNRLDPGRINPPFPWTCDTRVKIPDWW